LDFPLLLDKSPYGKVTFQCDETVRPERFELLSILARLTAVLLNAIIERDHAYASKEEWIQKAAKKSMSIISHNIATRFAGLALLGSRYRLREGDCPGIARLSEELEDAYRSIHAELDHAKEMFRGAEAHRQMVDLGILLSTCLSQWLAPDQFSVTIPDAAAQIPLDPRLMTGLFSELIKNSLDAQKDSQPLRVEVEVELFERQTSTWGRLVFSDNGKGIPDDMKLKIFEDFFTYHPYGKPGQGLGLTYVRNAVEAHGGTVHEEGHYGEGARIAVELPLYLDGTKRGNHA
jgi:signal transduction histidine kinase